MREREEVFCEGAGRMPEEEEEKEEVEDIVSEVFDKMWLREDVSFL